MNDNAWSQQDADDEAGDPCEECGGCGWIDLDCGCCVEQCGSCASPDDDDED